MRLNLGCGKNPLPGYVNVDWPDSPTVDHAINLDDRLLRLPWADSSVDSIYSSHMIEHIHNTLPLMGELYRVARPDCLATFACPYGSSDDAWENPTHVRPMFVGSWAFFGQPNYWREDYGYEGDWVVEEIGLRLPPERIIGGQHGARLNLEATWLSIRHDRNVVAEMVATLRANKPARPADRELQAGFPIVIEVLEPGADEWTNTTREVGRLEMGRRARDDG